MSRKGKGASVGIILAIMIAICSLAAVGHEPTVNEISALTAQVIKANPKFSDPNVVQIGDTVRVPLEVGFKTYEVKDWMLHKEQGCLWYISQMHLRGQSSEMIGPPAPSQTKSGETVSPASGNTAKSWPTPPPPPPVKAEGSDSSSMPWWFLVLLGLVLAMLLFYKYGGTLYRWIFMPIKATYPNGPPDDPDSIGRNQVPLNEAAPVETRSTPSPNESDLIDTRRFPPLIEGGLVPDLVQATQQIVSTNRELLGNHAVQLSQRGRLIRHSGREFINVMMRFREVYRNIFITPPVSVVRVVLDDGRILYVREACGNMFGLPNVDLGQAEFPLPDGWEFVADATYVPTHPLTTQPTAPNPQPATLTPTPAETPAQPTSATPPQDGGERTITITMNDGTKEVTLTAKGSADHMPTKVEQSDGKFVVLFPRGGDNPQR